MLEGEVPYRDAFDQKPPGVFVAYLGAFLLLGRSTEAIHLFAHLWSAGTAALLFLLLRRLAGEVAAALGVLVFAVVSTDAALGATAADVLDMAVTFDECLVRLYRQVLRQELDEEVTAVFESLLHAEERDEIELKKIKAMDYF